MFTLDTLFCWLSCRRGKRLSVRSVTSPCASLSVPAEESKGWSATIFYLLHSLIGKPKLILQIKNKPLTVSLLHFQSRPRGSKLHYILGRIYARIYPLDIGCLSCYNMCSGYIASSPVFILQIALSDVNISVVLLCSVIPYDFSIFFGKP